MSAYDPQKALTIGGRLILGPTQSGLVTGLPLDSAGYPTYGGTPIGYCRHAKLVREEEGIKLRSEALGLDAGWVRGFSAFSLAFILVQYDPTVLNRLWAYTTTSGGGYQGANTLREPAPGATLQPGVQTQDVPLLFAPDDQTQPGVLIYGPIFTNGPARQELEYRLDQPYETAVTVLAMADALNRVLACDLVENLIVGSAPIPPPAPVYPPLYANEIGYEVTFTYNGPTLVSFGALVAGDTILDSSVLIETEFDDPAAVVTLGTSLSPGSLLAAADINPGQVGTYGNSDDIPVIINDTLLVQVVPGASTQGIGRAVVSVRKA